MASTTPKWQYSGGSCPEKKKSLQRLLAKLRPMERSDDVAGGTTGGADNAIIASLESDDAAKAANARKNSLQRGIQVKWVRATVLFCCRGSVALLGTVAIVT